MWVVVGRCVALLRFGVAVFPIVWRQYEHGRNEDWGVIGLYG